MTIFLLALVLFIFTLVFNAIAYIVIQEEYGRYFGEYEAYFDKFDIEEY